MTRAEHRADTAATLDAVLALRDRGWRPFPLDHPALPECAGTGKRCRDGDCPPEKRGKHPVGGWGTMTAAEHPDQQYRYWFREPRNIGLGCKHSGLLVFDEDVDGALAALAAERGEQLPITYRVRTSRGWHYYYAAPADREVGNRAGPALAAAHIDVRGGKGDGGYVVAAGSVHTSGHLYVAEDPHVVPADPPGWLLDLIDETPERVNNAAGDLGLSGPRSSSRTAIDPGQWDGPRTGTPGELIGQYRTRLAEIRTRGGEFRHELFAAARDGHRLVALDLLDDATLWADLSAAVQRVWGAEPDADDKAHVQDALIGPDGAQASPWRLVAPASPINRASALDDGGRTVHADAYAGLLDAELADALGPEMAAEARDRAFAVKVEEELRRRAVRRAADEAERPPSAPIEEGILRWADLAEIEPPAMRVEGLLAEGAVSWLSGRSGSYKSFLAVGIALSVATGQPLCGNLDWAVSGRLRTLYIAAEGPAGVAFRARAYAAHHKLDAGQLDDWFEVRRQRVNLMSEREREDLRRYCREQNIQFVVYDTWHKVTPGAEEDGSRDVGIVMGFLDSLRDELGVESLVTDHTGHGGERTRGSSSKIDDADCSLIVKMPGRERTPDVQRTLVVDKLKDEETGASWDVRLAPVPAVVDRKGRVGAVLALGSVTAESDIHGDNDWRQAEVPADVRNYEGRGKDGLTMVAQIVMGLGAGESGVTRAEVLRQYRAAVGTAVAADAAFARVKRAWDALHGLRRLEPATGSGVPTGPHRWVSEP